MVNFNINVSLPEQFTETNNVLVTSDWSRWMLSAGVHPPRSTLFFRSYQSWINNVPKHCWNDRTMGCGRQTQKVTLSATCHQKRQWNWYRRKWFRKHHSSVILSVPCVNPPKLSSFPKLLHYCSGYFLVRERTWHLSHLICRDCNNFFCALRPPSIHSR